MKMKRSNLCFMMMICLLLPAVCFSETNIVSKEQKAEKIFNDAFRGFSESLADTKEENEDREKGMKEIVKIAPESAYGYFAKAYLLPFKDKIDLATRKEVYRNKILIYSKAINTQPIFPEAYYERGFWYGILGQEQEAVADFEKATMLNSKLIRAFYEIFRIDCFKYEINRDDITAKSIIGNANIIIMRSLSLKNRAADKEKMGKIYYYRGLAYSQMGESQKAIDDYTNAINLDPTRNPYFQRAELYMLINDKENALHDYIRAIELCNKDYDSLMQRAFIYSYRKQRENARNDYTSIIDGMKKEQQDISNKYQGKNTKLNNNPEAFFLFLNIHLTLSKAYLMRGFIYQEDEEFNNAINDFTAVINICESKGSKLNESNEIYNAWAYYSRAQCYFETGDYKRCVEDTKRAMSFHPDFYSECEGLLNQCKDKQEGLKQFSETEFEPLMISRLQTNSVKLEGNVAVIDFSPKGVSASDAATISDFIRSDLVNIGKVNVIERNNMEIILNEQKFQMSGCTDVSCAVKIGKILNVNNMVIGSLSKIDGVYFVLATIVDVNTGKILASFDKKAENTTGLRNACTLIVNNFGQ